MTPKLARLVVATIGEGDSDLTVVIGKLLATGSSLFKHEELTEALEEFVQNIYIPAVIFENTRRAGSFYEKVKHLVDEGLVQIARL